MTGRDAVPKSKIRKKASYTPKTNVTKKSTKGARFGSGRWVAPTMIALFLIGLAWIVVYYIAGSGNSIPIMSSLNNWNILLGFGFIGAGFALSTRWH
jgi:hypothetical protein